MLKNLIHGWILACVLWVFKEPPKTHFFLLCALKFNPVVQELLAGTQLRRKYEPFVKERSSTYFSPEALQAFRYYPIKEAHPLLLLETPNLILSLFSL